MKIKVVIFAWGIYSVMTLSVITNAILEMHKEWFGNFHFDLFGFLISCCGILIYTIAGMQFGSLKKLSGMKKDTIVTNGMYKYSRNPQFLGWWLLLCGLFLIKPNFLSLSVLLLGILLGFVQIIFEEKNLLLRYGKQYQDYLINVRRII